jgi:hypothetical protein
MGSKPCRPYEIYVHVGFGEGEKPTWAYVTASVRSSPTRVRRIMERWPFRAVTGTIAEQRRDDESGCQFSRTLVVSGPRQAVPATARSES